MYIIYNYDKKAKFAKTRLKDKTSLKYKMHLRTIKEYYKTETIFITPTIKAGKHMNI